MKKLMELNLRLQKVDGLPPKELRKLVDKGKKDLE
jgi:alanyl-tRNA synthetase